MELGARVAPGPGHRVRPTRPPILTAALRLADLKRERSEDDLVDVESRQEFSHWLGLVGGAAEI